jgi:RNA polymerase sigma factor (sigma-70 family)
MIATEKSLSSLMALSQSGDKDAYRTVLEESQRWLCRYYARRIAPSLIDDLVQETLLSLHNKRATFDPARPFLPWLAAIARYRWVDALRKVYRADETALDHDIEVGSHEIAVAARISLDGLLAHLPNGQAQAIRLVKIEGYSIAEAAARCGQTEPLVKVNIHRGL